jgi:hypothetical protein
MCNPRKLTAGSLKKMKEQHKLGDPYGAPRWITPEYIASCMHDKELQRGWAPKVGDWYLCTEFFMVAQITSLEEYRMSREYKSDKLKRVGSIENHGCDIYLPKPGNLEKLVA